MDLFPSIWMLTYKLVHIKNACRIRIDSHPTGLFFALSTLFSSFYIFHNQHGAAADDQRDDQDGAVSEKCLRQDLDDLVLSGIEDPVIFARKEDFMKNRECLAEIDGAQAADQYEGGQQTAAGPEADAAPCQSLWSNLRFALDDSPGGEQRPADEHDPQIQAEQAFHVHEMTAAPLAPGQIAGGKYVGAADAEVHHFVVRLADLPFRQAGGFHNVQRPDLHVIKGTDQDRRSDGCRQNEQRRTYDEANGQRFALFHE